MRPEKINWYKIFLFIAITYFLSWLVSFILTMNGMKLSQTKTAVIIAIFYMTMPALATVIVQKIIFRKDLKMYGWALPRKKQKYFGLLPVIGLSIIILTALIIYILGNQNLVANFGKLNFSTEHFVNGLNRQMAEKGSTADLSETGITALPPLLLYGLILFQGIFIGGIVNIPATFGEEFGWRGFLFSETKPLGFWGSSFFTGAVWGIWHFPLILIGLNYPNHHELGLILMVLFTLSLSPLFSYVRLKTDSILAPSILHGMINGTAGIFILCVAEYQELYSSIAGVAGITAGFIISMAVYLLDRKTIKNYYSRLPSA